MLRYMNFDGNFDGNFEGNFKNKSSLMQLETSRPLINKVDKAERHQKPNKISRRQNISQPATTGPGHVFSKFVDKVRVGPRKRLNLPLGNTHTGACPKGFAIELSPGAVVDEAVDMQVITVGKGKKFEYMLHVANNSHKPINAVVWQI